MVRGLPLPRGRGPSMAGRPGPPRGVCSALFAPKLHLRVRIPFQGDFPTYFSKQRNGCSLVLNDIILFINSSSIGYLLFMLISPHFSVFLLSFFPR